MVHLGDDYASDIVGVGDMQLEFANGSNFTLKNVRHVPKLTKSLISTRQLDDDGYHISFGDATGKLTNGSLIVAKDFKIKTLYTLHVASVKKNVASPPQNGVAKRMNRTIQKKDISMLSNANLLDGFWVEVAATTIHLIKIDHRIESLMSKF